jgi:hypothetical protein
MFKIILQFKRTIATTLLFGVVGLNACQKQENIAVFVPIATETQNQIAAIANVITANPESVTNAIKGISEGAASNARVGGVAEEVDAETKKAMEELQKDPSKVLTTIAKESQGADKIALLEGVFTQKDRAIIEQRLRVFQINTQGLLPSFNGIEPLKNGKVNCSGDCLLHVMAGASGALIGCAIAYGVTGWWTPWVKAGLLIAAGIGAGVLFGALKEWRDSMGYGNVEFRDFANTVLGGFAGGTLSWLIALITGLKHAVMGAVIMGVGGIIIGIPVVNCLFFKQC